MYLCSKCESASIPGLCRHCGYNSKTQEWEYARIREQVEQWRDEDRRLKTMPSRVNRSYDLGIMDGKYQAYDRVLALLDGEATT